MPALLLEPEDQAAGRPALLLVHDILGLTDDIDRIGARLVDEGYVVLIPDYFGPGRRLPCVVRAITDLRRGAGPAFDRLASGQDFLAGRAGVDPRRIGVVGFCLGGGFALLWAARSDAAAVATFYGGVPTDVDALRGLPPCVAGYGAKDRVFGPQAKRLRDHLVTLGVAHDLRVYPQAGHAYMNQHEGLVAWLAAHSPEAAGYEHGAAEDSWTRMLEFFERHLR